jgi:signal peptidase II
MTGVPILAQAIISAALLLAVTALFIWRFGNQRQFLLIALLVFLIDQATKAIALPSLARRQEVSACGGLLRFSLYPNTQQGFGSSFSGLLVTTLICVVLLLLLYRRLERRDFRMSRVAVFACAVMAGGYLGILLDRVRLGFVVDFLQFGPDGAFVYNLADLAVFFALALLLARGLRLIAAHLLPRPGPRPTRDPSSQIKGA